jgi:hypothetical protein
MSSVPLPTDDLHRRVAGTVGKLDAGAFTQLSMHPDRGVCVPGECPLLLPSCVGLPLVLTAKTFRPSPGGGVSQAFPATGTGGRGGPSRAEGRHRKEEGEEGREEGSGRLGEALSSAGEGWAPEGGFAGDA